MTGVAKVLVRRDRDSARKTGCGRSLGYYRERVEYCILGWNRLDLPNLEGWTGIEMNFLLSQSSVTSW